MSIEEQLEYYRNYCNTLEQQVKEILKEDKELKEENKQLREENKQLYLGA